MRACGLLLFLGSLAFGTIVQPDPVISTVCMVANQPVTCGYNDGFTKASTRTSVTMTGFGTNQIFINLDAYGEAGSYKWPDSGQPLSSYALALINLDFLGSTDGPVRPGLATFSIVADGDHGVGGGAYSTVSVEGIGSCAYPLCHTVGTLVPFTLGTTFEVQMFARGYGGNGIHALDGGDGFTYLRLSLFDTSGAPVNIYDPVSVPEPSSAYLIAPLCVLAVLRFRRHA